MRIVDNLTPKDIVETFPTGKTTVKRLIKESEDFLEEARITEQNTREFLATRVSMFDVDICTRLTMSAYYGERVEVAKEKLKRLRKILNTYEPPKKTPGEVTDEDIAKARDYPIKELIRFKNYTALCLWHNEKTPSLHLYKDNHVFCFSCHKRGDAIDVCMASEGLKFIEAVKYLNRL